MHSGGDLCVATCLVAPWGRWQHGNMILRQPTRTDLSSESSPEGAVTSNRWIFGTQSSLWELSEMPERCPVLPANCRMSVYIIWLFKNKGRPTLKFGKRQTYSVYPKTASTVPSALWMLKCWSFSSFYFFFKPLRTTVHPRHPRIRTKRLAASCSPAPGPRASSMALLSESLSVAWPGWSLSHPGLHHLGTPVPWQPSRCRKAVSSVRMPSFLNEPFDSPDNQCWGDFIRECGVWHHPSFQPAIWQELACPAGSTLT